MPSAFLSCVGTIVFVSSYISLHTKLMKCERQGTLNSGFISSSRFRKKGLSTTLSGCISPTIKFRYTIC
uniref:Uncharacterized protein n=1 Tax=Anguilla anguilla TaxID=7936 RepID=A0A0E9W0H2_ANGAN